MSARMISSQAVSVGLYPSIDLRRPCTLLAARIAQISP